jgi:N-(2-amino-2-carboxyethyl)-L-glutamate synthase
MNSFSILEIKKHPFLCNGFKFSTAASMESPMIADNSSEIILDKVFCKLSNLLSLKANLFLKIEGFNPAGSIKIKPAIRMLEVLEEKGEISPSHTNIIESSSGNLGVAVSLACSIKGYNFTCVSDPNISPRNEQCIKLFGGELIIVRNKDKNGGFLNSRIDLINQMLNENTSGNKKGKNLFWLNQYANEENKNAHYLSTAPSIFESIPEIDYLFVGAGTTGTLMGCAEYIQDNNLKTKIIAVDAFGSVTFGFPSNKRHIPGLGTSRRPEIVDESLLDDIVVIKEEDTIKMCRDILQKESILVGGSTGTVLAGIEAYKHKLESAKNIVAISPDLGEKYLDTIYNDKWVAERFPDYFKSCSKSLAY